MQAHPELLGAPTIGGGSARPWGGGREVIYTFTAVRNSQKRRKAVFRSKVFNKIYSRDVFRGIHEISRSLLKPLQRYISSKFQKSYTPPAARIRVNCTPDGCKKVRSGAAAAIYDSPGDQKERGRLDIMLRL